MIVGREPGQRSARQRNQRLAFGVSPRSELRTRRARAPPGARSARLRPGAGVEQSDRARSWTDARSSRVNPGTTTRRGRSPCAGPAMSAIDARASAAVRAMPGNSRRGSDRVRRRARPRPPRAAAGRPACAPLPHRAVRDGVLVWDRSVRGPLPADLLQPALLLPRGSPRERPRRARLRRRGGRPLRVARPAGSGGRRPAGRPACSRLSPVGLSSPAPIRTRRASPPGSVR